ncbi:VOC family protein [Mumia zhuanghuii]|uniref:VOC family protein n=1 Tax=Mumia zhuanghuii TaxID=2585211 RepID=A0A5C4MIB3_9ACTN|nr:VOC family protein [Mumia zhuanghuii]TNC42765.1 VOC family protein [Mumia zhuanghuii]TNC42797.1 VOC family protein [Mumia zhuanghuii]
MSAGARAETGIRLGLYVLDCPDPRALATFYAGLLGAQIAADSGDDWIELEGSGEGLAFQRVAHHEPPRWPDGVPQQAHLDLRVDAYEAPHALALSLGATALDPVTPPSGPQERGFRVYADPAGHPFCLCTC